MESVFVDLQVFAIHSNADNKLVDAHGHALPPCIIMERGESLDIWISRAKPDRLQACMVRTLGDFSS